MRPLILCLALFLAACSAGPEVNRAEVAEFIVFRGDDTGGNDRAFRVKLNGEVAGDLWPGDTLRQGVPSGRFTLTAETEPQRLGLNLGFDLALLERARKPFNMRPGRQVVVEVRTGAFGAPQLIERRGVEVRP